MPLIADGIYLDVAYRADLVVDGSVVVEIKSVEALHLRHVLQLKTYLRLGTYPLGLLLNFGTPRIEIRRAVP